MYFMKSTVEKPSSKEAVPEEAAEEAPSDEVAIPIISMSLLQSSPSGSDPVDLDSDIERTKSHKAVARTRWKVNYSFCIDGLS